MKSVIAVLIHCVYISNDTCQPVELTDTEKLLSSIYSDKYSFVELYTPVKMFTGKTYKAIQSDIDRFTTVTNRFDYHFIITKK